MTSRHEPMWVSKANQGEVRLTMANDGDKTIQNESRIQPKPTSRNQKIQHSCWDQIWRSRVVQRVFFIQRRGLWFRRKIRQSKNDSLLDFEKHWFVGRHVRRFLLVSFGKRHHLASLESVIDPPNRIHLTVGNAHTSHQSDAAVLGANLEKVLVPHSCSHRHG